MSEYMLNKFQATLQWLQSDNRKPAPSIDSGQALSLVEGSAMVRLSSPRIQNRKWLGLLVIAFALVVAGAVAQAQQPTKVPRIGYLTGGSSTQISARTDDIFRF